MPVLALSAWKALPGNAEQFGLLSPDWAGRFCGNWSTDYAPHVQHVHIDILNPGERSSASTSFTQDSGLSLISHRTLARWNWASAPDWAHRVPALSQQRSAAKNNQAWAWRAQDSWWLFQTYYLVCFLPEVIETKVNKSERIGTSPWLRLCTPNAGGHVQFLVEELDPWATTNGPACHNADRGSQVLLLRPGSAKWMKINQSFLKVYFLNANIFKCLFSPLLYANCTFYSHICGPLLNLFRTHFFKKFIPLSKPMVLNRSGFWPPGDIWQCLLTFLVVTAGGWGRMLLAFYGQRTEMQVSIQQCTGHPKSSKHYSSSAGNPNQTQAPVKNKQREQALWVFLVVVAVQSLSHVQLFATPMDCSTPGFPVLHHLPELGQTQVHWVSDAIQPSHPLSCPFSPTFNLSQHQGLF